MLLHHVGGRSILIFFFVTQNILKMHKLGILPTRPLTKVDTRDAGALGNEKNNDNDEEKAFIDKSCTMHIANINLSFEKATSVALNKANRELFISPLFPLIICSLPLQFLVFLPGEQNSIQIHDNWLNP